MPELTVRRIAVGLVILAALGLVGGYGVAMGSKPKPVSLSFGSPAPKKSEAAARKIYIHVAGAVSRPGLYVLRDGARVDDAIRAAGGVLAKADLDALNLASKLKDGDKILVPVRGAASSGEGSSASKLVNLNTATVSELDTLPGIGPALADRIIDYRTQHDGFRTVAELQKVPGIGPAKFGQLKDLVTV